MSAQQSSSLLRNRDFVLLWVAQGISSFGDALTSLALIALVTFPMALVVNVWGMIAVSFALTFFSTPLNISIGAFIQARVPNEILGRVGASLNVVIQSSSLISMAFAGVLATSIGVRGVFVVSAVLCALAGVYALIAFRNESNESISDEMA